jgi:hypothetical protein
MTPKLLRRQLEQKLGRNEGEFDEEAIKARITVIMNEEVEALGVRFLRLISYNMFQISLFCCQLANSGHTGAHITSILCILLNLVQN